MDEQEIRSQLVVASKRAYTRGIQTNNGGNVSARIPGKEWMLIKGSGTSFIDGTEEDLVIADWKGNLVEGATKPSREATLHGFLYEALPQVNAVVHTHSPYAIAWSNLGKDYLPKVTHHSAMKVPSPVPVFHVKTAAVQPEDLPMLRAAFEKGEGVAAFLLEGHGIVAMGKDPIAAEHMAELIEETAQIAVLQKLMGALE